MFSTLSCSADAPGCFLLESLAGPERDIRNSFLGLDPVFHIDITTTHLVLSGVDRLIALAFSALSDLGFTEQFPSRFRLGCSDDAWHAIRAIRALFVVDDPACVPPLSFAFFGYFSYDAARLIEDLPCLLPFDPDDSLIRLSLFSTVLCERSGSGDLDLVEARSPFWPSAPIDFSSLVLRPGSSEPLSATPPRAVHDSVTEEAFERSVRRALDHIRVGDIYQIQLGHALTIDSSVPPWTAYRRLLARNPSPYMFFVQWPDVTLVGASPELYVRVEGDAVSMRPIAGTARRSGDPVEDARIARALSESPKEVAEHVMLVDLCRNDMARVCRSGTLVVDEYLVLEKYSNLFHLVSNVAGVRRSSVDGLDIIRATFPAGTMTGAPKVRAMELIEEYEMTRRGVYSGALGLLDICSNDLVLCLSIRMGVYRRPTYSIRASAGIVADSVASREWEETLTKLGSMYLAVTGAELSL